jgi:hypothetical protein
LTSLRRISPATALFAAAVAASGVLLLVWQSHLTFFFDDWDPLLDRRGLSADALLRPHIDHILLATTVVYKTIQATIGMNGPFPYAVVSTAAFLLSVVLLFVYMRRRVGEWLALAGVLPILFLGAAARDLLWSFQIFFFGAMACGLGALLVLERPRRNADVVACALLTLSFTFSELALPFVLGAAVLIVQDRGPRRRAYVVAVPLLFYAVWYAGWGHDGQGHLSFDNLAHSVGYVLDGLASGLSSLFGLTPRGFAAGGGLDWGRPLLVAALLVVGIRVTRSRVPLPRWLWVSAVVLLSFWFLTALNATVLRPPMASRYQYAGAILILLVAADLAAGVVRPRSPTLLVGAFAVAGLSVMSNISVLHDTYKGLSGVTPTIRGGLAGLEIESDTVDPNLELDEQNSGFNYLHQIRAGPYLSAVDAFGSPAYSQSELAGAPENARVAADLVMGTALGPVVRPGTRPPAATSCRAIGGGPGQAAAVLSVPSGGAVFLRPAHGVTATVKLRRFAMGSFPVSAGELTGPGVLSIPADRSHRPWQLQLDATGPVTACAARTE